MLNSNVELKKVSVLEDLGRNVVNLLEDETIQDSVKSMVSDELVSHLIYYDKAAYPSSVLNYVYQVDGEVRRVKKVLSDEYHKTSLIALSPVVSTKLRDVGIDIDTLEESERNRLRQVFAKNFYFYRQDPNEMSAHRISSYLHTPIYASEEDDLVVIATYQLSVQLSRNDISSSLDDVEERDIYSKDRIILEPLSAFVYSKKYSVRYFEYEANREKQASYLILPHNMSKHFHRSTGLSSMVLYDMFVADEEVRKEFLSNSLVQEMLKEISERANENHPDLRAPNNMTIKKVKENPEILFERYSTRNMNSVFASLSRKKKVSKSGRVVIDNENLEDFFSIKDYPLVENMTKYIQSLYVSALIDKDRRNITCHKCNHTKEITNKELAGEIIVCPTCGSRYVVSLNTEADVDLVVSQSRSYVTEREKHFLIVHAPLKDEWIDENNKLIENVPFDELDPLSIVNDGIDFRRRRFSYGENIFPLKRVFINDVSVINEEIKAFTRMFDIALTVVKEKPVNKNFFNISFTDILVSVDGEQYFSAKFDNSKEKTIYKKVLPSQAEVFGLDDIYCLNKEETELIYKSRDKYDILSHYMDAMNIEEGSNYYYNSMALLEGIYANYIIAFPKIEALLKSNFKKVATGIFEESLPKREIRRIFDMTKNKPKDICNLSEIDTSNMGSSSKVWRLSEIRNIGYVKYIADFVKIETGLITSYTLIMMSIWENNVDELRTIINRVVTVFDENENLDRSKLSCSKLVEYAGRCFDAQAMSLDDIRDYWSDYVEMASDLNYDLNKSAVLFPNSLKREHDIVARAHSLVANHIEEEKFFKRIKEDDYKKLAYMEEDEDYAIIIPSEAQDVINEGLALSHCVGSYVRKVVDGKSYIVFLRDKRDLSRSLITIEVKKDRVVQVRGASNRGISSYHNEHLFLERWIENKGLVSSY